MGSFWDRFKDAPTPAQAQKEEEDPWAQFQDVGPDEPVTPSSKRSFAAESERSFAPALPEPPPTPAPQRDPWAQFKDAETPSLDMAPDVAAPDKNVDPWAQFKDVEPLAKPATEKESPYSLSQGFMGSLVGTNPKLVGDAAEGFGVMLDNPALQDVGKKIAGFGVEQLKSYEPRVPSFTDVRTDSFGNFLSDVGAYGGYQMGSALGTSAPSLVVGGAAALATANPLVGLAMGAAGPSYIQNFGDVYGSARDEPGIKARIENGELTPKQLANTAAIAAVPIAALDLIGLQAIMGKAVFGPAKKTLLRDILHGIATGAIAEGSTEGLQQVVSEWAQTHLGSRKPLYNQFVEVIDNFIAGTLGGSAIGGGGAGIAYSAQAKELQEGAAKGRALGFPPQEGDTVPALMQAARAATPVPPSAGPAPVSAPIMGAPEAAPEEPPELPSVATAGLPMSPPASPDEISILKGQGWSADAISEMGVEERAKEIADALEQGLSPLAGGRPAVTTAGLAEDRPSAEPIVDLRAQAADLTDPANPRQAVWIPRESYDQLRKDRQALKEVVGSGVRVPDFDGQGGVLIARDEKIAAAAKRRRDAGDSLQAVIGELTGAGVGKPAGGTAVVQQVTPEGGVARESLVTPETRATTEQSFATPGREVRTVAPREALQRRQDLIQADGVPVAGTLPSQPSVPGEAGRELGSVTAPVKVVTPDDIAAAVTQVAEPSEAQKESGNYRKAHLDVQGLPITIENAKGSIRRGKDKDGETWETVLPAHYGYIKRSEGKDGDQVDVYVGDSPQSDKVFIVDQLDLKTGKMDEHKAILGTLSETEARSIYTKAFSDGKGAERIGAITAMSVQEFKEWLAKGKRTRPVGDVAAAEAPIVQFRKDAAEIEAGLPPVPEDHTRLWRGNRPGEIGANPSFTNDLPGIALPFQKAYGGKLSYVDVPTADLAKYENKAGAAPGAEFTLPNSLASKAMPAAPEIHAEKERTEPVKTRPKAVEEQAEKDSGKPDQETVPAPEPEPKVIDALVITTPDGSMEVASRKEIVEAASLRQASGELQPRDRARAESVVGVRERAARLDPSRLLPQRRSDSGAPIVSPDGTILSGNGRVLSIREAYKDPKLIRAYRATVLTQADRLGIKDAVAAMAEPVIISRVTKKLSKAELAKFADLSNRPSIAAMSATERAMRDAKAAKDVLASYQGGKISSPKNRAFLNAFIGAVVTPAEQGAFSKDGNLTKEGIERVDAALLAAAYGDPELLSVMLESTDDNVRAFTKAMRDAAGSFVTLKADIEAGLVPAKFDISADLAATVRLIADLRRRSVSPKEYLAQTDAFATPRPITEALLRAFYNEDLSRALSQQKITEVLTDYAEEAGKQRAEGLLPGEATPEGIVTQQRARRTREERQGDLLAGSTARQELEEDRVQAQRPEDEGGGAEAVAGGTKLRQVRVPAEDGSADMLKSRFPLQHKSRRDSVKTALKMGKAVSLARPAKELLDLLKAQPAMLPDSVRESVVEKIEPYGDHFKITARDTKGDTLEFYDTYEGVSGTVGLFSVLPDGTPYLAFFSFEPGGSLSDRLKGGRAHEGVHALREIGLLPGSASEPASPWGRLLGHANLLGVMSQSVREFAMKLGHPDAVNWSNTITLGESYKELYKNYPRREEALDQEAVAHMVQLYVHGQLSEQEAAPVKDLLDSILSGETARGTPVLEAANPRMQEFVEALEGRRSFLPEGETLRAIGDSERAMRRMITARLRAGQSIAIAEEVTEAVLDAVQPHLDMVPIGTHVAAVTRLEPRIPTRRNPADVRVHYRTADGYDAHFEITLAQIGGSRAITSPDGELILVLRFSRPPSQQVGPSVGGVADEGWVGAGGQVERLGRRGDSWSLGMAGLIAHEAVHAARIGQTIRTSFWRRLLEHANVLQILDMELRTYLERIGDPTYQNAAPGKTIRSAYLDAYAEASDLKEYLDQESVAVMTELAVNGSLTAYQLGMVAEDIRTALGGERRFAASDRQGGPLYALAPEVSDRELDQFGLYSSSLEAAKRIPQEKGTVEQMRAMLLTAGAAPKELEAVGFDKAFPDPQAKVSKGEIEAFLRDNRVTLGSKVKTSSLSPQEEAEVAELSAHGEWRRVEEIRREAGGAKFETYSTPGGIPGSYREVVVTLPITKTDVVENLRERLARREITQEQFDAKVASQASDYTSSHWPGIANPLLHYRVKDFAAVNGKTRVLDELQSDWAQRARDQGTRDPARIEELKRQIAEQADKRDGMASLMARTAEELAPGSTDTTDALVILRQLERSHPNTPQGKRAAGLLGDLRQVENNHMDLMSKLAAAERETPSAPFISNTSDWVDLGLKQALVDAARDPAVTRFAWAPGKVQADRYHLSHVADEIRYHPDSETLDLLRGGKLEHSRTVRQGDLPDYIGKEMAEQLMATEPVKARDGRPWHKLKNIADIKIGGEGMKSFYGDFTKEGSYTPGIVGTRLLKLVRQLDPEAARIEPTELQIRDRSAPYNAKEGEPTRDYPSIPITPKLREKLLQGLPMFGAEKVRTLGSVIPQGKARADLQEGMQDAVNAALGIVARIAGRGVRVELRDIIPTAEVLSERQMAEVEGVVGRVSPTAGGFYRPSTLNADALIGLATNDPAFDLNTAAGHEAWHHVKEALATPAEKRLLNLSAERARMRRLAAAELGMGIDDARLEKLDPREIEAYAFQRYRRLAEEEAGSASGLHIAIRKLFDRIIQVLRAVRNAMNGLGYQTYEDVFERARTGEIAQREDREYFVSGEASEQVGSSRLLTSTPAETGREIAPVVLEGELLPSFAEQLAAAQKSQYWPESWFSETSRGIYPPHLKTESNLADAVRHVQEMEASNAWHALVFPDGIRRVGEERHVAEARAYRENPQLWESYRNAKIAFLEGRKGRPLTEGELMWESLDRPPTSPEATASELMDTYGREKFMVAGHPDLARRHEERLRHAEQKRLSAPSQQVLSGEGTQAAISSEGLPETDPSLLASVIPRGVINAQSGGTLGRRASAMLRRADPLRVKIQDKMLPVRRVIEAQRAAGIDVPIAMDTYVAEAIFHGRAGERMENLQRDYIEPLTEGMRLSNVSLEQLDEYLYARHAPERNAAIAQIDPINLEGSGMAGAEAQAIMDRVATSGKQGEYDALARIIDDMITDALNTRVAAGLMTSEDRDAWRAKYSSYVPLRGFEASDESTDPDRPRSGQGMQVRGPESKRALGRSSKADSPVSYAVLQAMEAIVRSEKNRVFKTLYRNVEANPDPMWNIYKGESVKRFNPSTGLVERKWRAPQTFMGSDNDLLSGKIGGKTVYLEIKHRGLLRAMKGVGAETQGPIVNAMMRVMRIYAQLLTSWNPEFTIPNFFRDMQTALGNISDVADKPVNIRRQILKDAYSAKSIRGILSALRGGGQHEYASWFEEYRLAGGKISFMEYNDVQRIKKRIVASLNDGDTTRAMKSAFTLIEDINTAVENGVRLSSYIALRKAGIAKDRAAFIARELTVNFNRKGEWGAAINSMYLFFNASAQGSVRLAQAVYRSKALRYALGGLFVSAMVLDWWNALLAGDDDDGENYYDQIPDWIKERNIVIVTGSKKEDYVTIPLAYGYNVPYLAGQQLGSVLRGKKEPLAAAANVASGAMESFNPLGSAVSFWQYVSPTILDPGVQMLENKTWYGGPIYPTKFDKRQPDSELYWNTTPWYWKESARILNAGTGGNVGRPGYVDVSPETIQHYVEFVSGGLGKFAANAIQTGQQLFSGEEWIPEKTPLMRRFYGKATTVSKRRQFYEAWDEVDAAVYEINKLKKNDQREEAKQAMSRYPAQVKVHGLFKGTQKTLKNLRDQRDKITANERMSQPDKRLRIEAIIERENVIVQKALDAYHEAVREQAKKKPVPFPEPMRVGLRDLAQAEPTPQEKLRERGYTDSFPPLVSEQGVWGQKQEEAIRLYMKPRIDALTAIGVPPDEAFAEIRAMPDVVTEVQRLGREGAADPHLREKERKLLEDLR